MAIGHIMDLSNPLILLAIGVAVVLLTVAATRYASRQAPSKLEQTAEQELFKVATEALKALADTSGEDKEIAAATQRKALKAQLLQQARDSLAQ